MEYHPRLTLGNLKIPGNKIILGSFPTWPLSDITNCNPEIISEKLEIRKKKGDFPFFFGSSTNLFWKWYKEYIDQQLDLNDIFEITYSLERHNIGITDIIKSCERKGRSALDQHLIKRTYNHSFFDYPQEGSCLKILCTSKGILNQMLLNKSFFKIHPKLILDKPASDNFEHNYMRAVNGNSQIVKAPIFRSISVIGGGTIECLAIPSPGSPYRSLSNFGLPTLYLNIYLSTYIKAAFNWFAT